MQINDPEWTRLVTAGAESLGVLVSACQAAQLGVHAQEMLLWNKKTNLTAITLPQEVAIKHVVDSLAIARWIPAEASLLDVGSGGGFPGIPLKILMPSLSVTLIDSSRKKNSFQRHVIRRLGLVGIAALQTRIEALSENPDSFQGGNAGTFSVIVCRAFTNLAHFVEMAAPLLASSGTMLAMKGRINGEELAAVSDVVSRMAGGFHARTLSYTLPVIHAERYVYMLTSAPQTQSW
ncbi:MAG: 16S rRNA (guanine(527)-N(7))-methyltransferase RsmG [Desulfatirhabdiaceae bacterium]|nr:16S rRNA (guanine(527)-N(7))-methyltransferase RsmG [Desulfatirhabdiaceae bacterium]